MEAKVKAEKEKKLEREKRRMAMMGGGQGQAQGEGDSSGNNNGSGAVVAASSAEGGSNSTKDAKSQSTASGGAAASASGGPQVVAASSTEGSVKGVPTETPNKTTVKETTIPILTEYDKLLVSAYTIRQKAISSSSNCQASSESAHTNIVNSSDYASNSLQLQILNSIYHSPLFQLQLILITRAIPELGLDPNSYLVGKCMEIAEHLIGSQTSTSSQSQSKLIFLTGPSGSWKSAAWQALHRALSYGGGGG